MAGPSVFKLGAVGAGSGPASGPGLGPGWGSGWGPCSESGWTETSEEVSEEACEEYRMDPYDHKMYTKSEFYEWYGSRTLWDISHPENQYKRDLIWE